MQKCPLGTCPKGCRNDDWTIWFAIITLEESIPINLGSLIHSPKFLSVMADFGLRAQFRKVARNVP
jgi:hypothetical protein